MLATRRFRVLRREQDDWALTNALPASIPAGPESVGACLVGSVIKKRRKKMRKHKKKKLLKRARHKRKR
jgi:hypothetical protein